MTDISEAPLDRRRSKLEFVQTALALAAITTVLAFITPWQSLLSLWH
jgi:hypothetical protein